MSMHPTMLHAPLASTNLLTLFASLPSPLNHPFLFLYDSRRWTYFCIGINFVFSFFRALVTSGFSVFLVYFKSAVAKALPKEPLKSPLEAKCCGSHLAEPILPAAGTRRVKRKHSRDGPKCSCQRKGGLTLVETHKKAFATSLGCHEKREPPNPSPMSRSSLTLGPF